MCLTGRRCKRVLVKAVIKKMKLVALNGKIIRKRKFVVLETITKIQKIGDIIPSYWQFVYVHSLESKRH